MRKRSMRSSFIVVSPRRGASYVVSIDGIVAARLGHEEVRPAPIGRTEELDRRIALRERRLECLTRGEPPRECELRVARLQLLEPRRDLEQQVRVVHRWLRSARTFAVGSEDIADALAFGIFEGRRAVLAFQ